MLACERDSHGSRRWTDGCRECMHVKCTCNRIKIDGPSTTAEMQWIHRIEHYVTQSCIHGNRWLVGSRIVCAITSCLDGLCLCACAMHKSIKSLVPFHLFTSIRVMDVCMCSCNACRSSKSSLRYERRAHVFVLLHWTWTWTIHFLLLLSSQPSTSRKKEKV